MDYNKAALELHSKFPGKIAVQSLCECKDRDVPQDQGKPR